MSQNANFQMILQDYENVTTQIEMETRWEIYLAFTTFGFVPTCAGQEFCRANPYKLSSLPYKIQSDGAYQQYIGAGNWTYAARKPWA